MNSGGLAAVFGFLRIVVTSAHIHARARAHAVALLASAVGFQFLSYSALIRILLVLLTNVIYQMQTTAFCSGKRDSQIQENGD